MWVWIVGFVVLCTIIAVVIARRGPGDGGDHSAEANRHDPYHGPQTGGGGFGDGGGGF
ncbi:MAG TPA: hypothetical protein VFI47_06245 [Acidimicrobiales bacterium]|nr:hypothetical protein [Acidimicrobiales bacterium]